MHCQWDARRRRDAEEGGEKDGVPRSREGQDPWPARASSSNVRQRPLRTSPRRAKVAPGVPMTDAEQWSHLTDASGQTYDPRPALAAIADSDADAGYDELWQRLHHQGDLGTAAYAAVPELVRCLCGALRPDWRAYALVATIEERRQSGGNPAIPPWLSEQYHAAVQSVVDTALGHLRLATGDETVRSIIAVLAHAKGQHTIGAIALWTEDERQEVLGSL